MVLLWMRWNGTLTWASCNTVNKLTTVMADWNNILFQHWISNKNRRLCQIILLWAVNAWPGKASSPLGSCLCVHSCLYQRVAKREEHPLQVNLGTEKSPEVALHTDCQKKQTTAQLEGISVDWGVSDFACLRDRWHETLLVESPVPKMSNCFRKYLVLWLKSQRYRPVGMNTEEEKDEEAWVQLWIYWYCLFHSTFRHKCSLLLLCLFITFSLICWC